MSIVNESLYNSCKYCLSFSHKNFTIYLLFEARYKNENTLKIYHIREKYYVLLE